MAAKNILQKYWDGSKWIELHPITSAGNVYNGVKTVKQHMEEGETAHGGIVSPDDPRLADARVPLEHGHDALEITSGTISMERLPVAPNGASSGNHLVRSDDQRLSRGSVEDAIQSTDQRNDGSTTKLLQAKAMKDHVESGDHDTRYARVAHTHNDVISLERLPVANDGQVSGLKLVRADDSRLAAAGDLPSHDIADHGDATGTTPLRNSSSTTLLLQAKAMKDHVESDDHADKYAAKTHQHDGVIDIDRLPVAASGTSSSYQLVRSDDSRLSAAGVLPAHDIATHTDVSGATASRDSASTTLLLQAKAMKDHVESDDHADKYAAKTHAHTDAIAIDRLPVAASGTSSSTALVRADDSRLAAAGELFPHKLEDHTDVTGMTAVRDSASTTLLLQAKAMKDHVESDDHADKYAAKTHAHTDAIAIDRLPVAASGTSSSTALVRADDSRLTTSPEHNLASHTDVTGMTAVRDSDSTTLLLQAKAMKDHVESDDHADKYAAKTHSHTKTDVGLGNVDNVKQMPIAGGSFTGAVTFGGEVTIKNSKEQIVATTGAVNLADGNVFTITPASNVTFSFTGATAGFACTFSLFITMGATVRTATWPSSVKWDKEKVPEMDTANKVYELSFKTINGGSNWLGVIIGEF